MQTAGMPRGGWRTSLTLGLTQLIAWGSTFYLAAILAGPMAAELALTPARVFAAFSSALVLSGLVGPWAGRVIDRQGGRRMLMVSNGVFALGLVALARAEAAPGLFFAWAVLGLAMGGGLYEAAFATVVALYRDAARGAITGITLVAGFASTVSWPLTLVLEDALGWRGTCLVWAALHVCVALPLNACLPRTAPPRSRPRGEALREAAERTVQPRHSDGPQEAGDDASRHPASSSAPAARMPPAQARWRVVILAYAFAVVWFLSTAMAAHLPRLLTLAGVGLGHAVAVGALVGPAQVAGRLLEAGFLRRVSPLVLARLALLAHPLGAASLLAFGAAAVGPFTLLHGFGNGLLTIAMGTLPLVIFGATGYGARQGWLMLPGRVAQAAAPFLFGLALDVHGVQVAWLSGGLALSACAALLCVRVPRSD